jgi:hypothetical protein
MHHVATLKTNIHKLCHSLMTSHNTINHVATLKVAMDDVSWGRAVQNINIGVKLASYAGPGHWNNLGLMAFGHQQVKQNRAQFSIFAMLASPLILSGSVGRVLL